ncbi:MAG TPA: class I SAM-dependent methyltransferase [Burkholderiales bacterium]|nr:class I SAM-dependent methyltransferase [Burkholderiales bacterium]
MAQTRIDFADASGYELFMGRWSRAVAGHFLQWIKPRPRAKWLDVGCGTGILTEAVLDLCAPASVVGIDPAGAQIDQASRGPAGPRAKFRQADAMSLPFPDRSFDIVASALVINFIPDPLPAVQEMRRVTALGGMLAGYVWDFGREFSPSGPLRQAMRAFGAEVPPIPGTAHSSVQALESLFVGAGLDSIQSTSFDVTLAYPGFEDFWDAQTPSYSPTTKVINAMTESERQRLKRAVQAALPIGPNGKIEYAARANAVRGAVTNDAR